MVNAQEYRTEYYAGQRPEMLKFVPPHLGTFLEIGCGEGNFSHLVKSTYLAETWGIEPNEDAALIAREKVDHLISGIARF